MSIRRHGWDLSESRITPESIYLNRRHLIAGGVALAAAATVGGFLLNRSDPAAQALRTASSDPSRGLYPAARNERYTAHAITAEERATTYNNFYEFGAGKNIVGPAQSLITRPWEMRFEGLVETPFTLGIDDLLKRVDLEERVYRHRCVEGWSMVVPWTGFPLKALLDIARPLGAAKYLRMEAFDNPATASGQKQSWYPWPYVEALTMAEAANELAFVVTGAYGKPIAKTMGAPMRVVVPWKYGFKSIKSIIRWSFVEERPETFWPTLNGREYGFWANVNPEVIHAFRSQATERDLGTGEIIPTERFNGYGELVAGLYAGMEDEPLFM